MKKNYEEGKLRRKMRKEMEKKNEKEKSCETFM